MQVELYELSTGKPTDIIENVTALNIRTITAEIQVLDIRYAAGNTRGIEIDASCTGIHITG